MNAPVENLAASVAGPALSGDFVIPRLERAIVFALRVICLCGLVLANYYSWTMTVTGFVNAKLLPDNSVISNTYIPLVVAGFVQLGIFAFYLSFPYFQKRHFVINAVAIVFASFLICVTIIFSVFSITLTSQAENIVTHQISLVQGMNKTLVDLDDLISTTFRSHLAYLDTLAARACGGKDRTGIAKCGPIAQSFTEKANDLGAKYGSQLGIIGSYGKTDSINILDSLNALRSNYVKLGQKVDVYKEFTSENNLSNESVSKAFDALKLEIDDFSQSLNQRKPDAKTLVLSRVFDDFGLMARGRGESITYFALVIALLPDALSITFTVLLLIARAANQRALSLRRAIDKASEEAKWYDRYANAVSALHRAKQRWRDRRRVANVAEAVDQSVPDLAANDWKTNS